jgi:ribosome-binding factor A
LFHVVNVYFYQMESNRQKKISKILQQDLAEILQGAASKGGLMGIIISVSKVSVTTDLSIAKVHLSVFPSAKGPEILAGIKTNTPIIKHEISQRTRHQLRRTPNFMFFIDDSLDYIEKIDRSLKGTDNPLKP